jgi:hypothetical protein
MAVYQFIFISIIDLASDVYFFFQTFSQRLLNLNKQLAAAKILSVSTFFIQNLGGVSFTKKNWAFHHHLR